MLLTARDVRGMGERELRAFLSLRIPEGQHLDYKRSWAPLLGRKDEKRARREFLKDISSFANANGGHLVIGVQEPRPELPVDEQAEGVEKGEELAETLERVASSSLDPRIPGLLIHPVPLASGRYVLVVHIPPSLTRPHRVEYGGKVGFFLRHRESSFQMTTHEIRSSVLASTTAEDRARSLLDTYLEDVERYLLSQSPLLVAQAAPLIGTERPWDVHSEALAAALRDDLHYRRRHFGLSLACDSSPLPTLDGVAASDRSEDPSWRVEVHRNGHIAALLFGREFGELDGDNVVLSARHCEFFAAFSELCDAVLRAARADGPYVLRATLLKAQDAHLRPDDPHDALHGPYRRPRIEWPPTVRETGEPFTPIGDSWSELLYNAFGLRRPAPPPAQQDQAKH